MSVPIGLLLAILLGLIPAAIASGKGRSFIGWWLFGALLWIVALPLALIVGKDNDALESRQLATGGVRKCPQCAEIVRADAILCRYCSQPLPEMPVKNSIPASAPSLALTWTIIITVALWVAYVLFKK